MLLIPQHRTTHIGKLIFKKNYDPTRMADNGYRLQLIITIHKEKELQGKKRQQHYKYRRLCFFGWNPILYWESNRKKSYSHFVNTTSWSVTQHWGCCPFNGGDKHQVAGIRDLQATTQTGTSKQPHIPAVDSVVLNPSRPIRMAL